MPAPWNAVTGLIAEIKRCESAGATAAAIAMAYICIDTMTFLSMPDDQSSQTRADFIAWVDRYLKGHTSQPYQYDGKDVYAARCAVLHAFSSEAEWHRQDATIKQFGYHDGGLHAFDPMVSPNTVIIGTASLLNDVIIAVESFMQHCKMDSALRARTEARLPKLLQTIPFSRPMPGDPENQSNPHGT